MGQVSPYLRRSSGGYTHWCPGCLEMHRLPDSGWTFNGDLNKPTFQPSFKHTGVKTVKDKNGQWTGEWVLDANGKAIPDICHYILTNGILNFCSDCTHEMAGKPVPLPELPEFYRDGGGYAE
jgi:uncharacterized protein DUF6527